MRDEFYWQLKSWKCVMCLQWNHAVLFESLSHNLMKSEFHVKKPFIKFEITMNLKVFYLHFDFNCKIDV
jgi:hypothetical protein